MSSFALSANVEIMMRSMTLWSSLPNIMVVVVLKFIATNAYKWIRLSF